MNLKSAFQEALTRALVRPSAPLLPTDFSITPAIGRFLFRLVGERAPELIVECGAGFSTILMAYALKRRRKGRIVALEHDARYAEQTRLQIRTHGLEDWARVIDAPLADWTSGGHTWRWYRTEGLGQLGGIDLLFVDGPPGHLQADSRYPARPLLFEKLSPNAVVVLDDTDRQDEQRILRRWLEESGGRLTVMRTAGSKNRHATVCDWRG